MYQKIQLIGNVGNEPEMRYLPNGTPVASFNLAVNEHWTVDGEKREKTIWFRVTVWRKTAEIVTQYVHKGSKVFVDGKMEAPNAYLDKAGKPAASLEVTANEVKFLDGKPQGDEAPAQRTERQTPQPAKRAPEKEEDIPW